MIGDGNSERVITKEYNACQNIYSVSKVYTVTAVGVL